MSSDLEIIMCGNKLANLPITEMEKVSKAKHELATRVENEEICIGPYEEKYQLCKLINAGAFGQIYFGQKVGDSHCVAVKIEHPMYGMEQLLYEGQVYRKLENGPGIAHVFWYGMHGSHFNALVMELMGSSLQDLFESCERKLSLKTVLLLADQMVDTINFIHTQGFVHRDISTNNFMTGRGENAQKIYLVDFGLAKKFESSPSYRHGKSNRHFSFNVSRPAVGTARFCSIFTHKGEAESRRDDLQSLGFLWIYLLKGRLPWQGLHAVSAKDKLQKIYEKKLTTPLEDLCEGLPSEFLTYLNFVSTMNIYDIPNYTAIKQLFEKLAESKGYEYDFNYDWSEGHSKERLHAHLELNSLESSSPSNEPVSH